MIWIVRAPDGSEVARFNNETQANICQIEHPFATVEAIDETRDDPRAAQDEGTIYR